jgi:hypothetical protein
MKSALLLAVACITACGKQPQHEETAAPPASAPATPPVAEAARPVVVEDARPSSASTDAHEVTGPATPPRTASPPESWKTAAHIQLASVTWCVDQIHRLEVAPRKPNVGERAKDEHEQQLVYTNVVLDHPRVKNEGGYASERERFLNGGKDRGAELGQEGVWMIASGLCVSLPKTEPRHKRGEHLSVLFRFPRCEPPREGGTADGDAPIEFVPTTPNLDCMVLPVIAVRADAR